MWLLLLLLLRLRLRLLQLLNWLLDASAVELPGVLKVIFQGSIKDIMGSAQELIRFSSSDGPPKNRQQLGSGVIRVLER
jgi:hypothetical protein